MKTLLLILFPFVMNAQCKPSKDYILFPSFLNLYFGGECLSGNFSDTVICAKFKGSLSGRIPYFSASSPIGNIGTVTINPSEIYPSADSVEVRYTISGGVIDNFCPYAFVLNPLAVEFCGVNAESDGSNIAVQWATCSNHNTSHFNVIISGDLNNWTTARSIPPYEVNKSGLSVYKTRFPYRSGLWYIRIMETDLNGDKTLSDVVKVSVQESNKIYFDILGRQTNKEQFQWLSK